MFLLYFVLSQPYLFLYPRFTATRTVYLKQVSQAKLFLFHLYLLSLSHMFFVTFFHKYGL